MKLLDGKACAFQIKTSLSARVQTLKTQGKRVPKLAIILVGDNPDSHNYVRSKYKTCLSLGIDCDVLSFPARTDENELLQLVDTLNNDNTVDGILVQLPLPEHLNTSLILDYIDYQKDADGLHPMNVGLLHLGQPYMLPCTPNGIVTLLKTNDITIARKHAVVIGRSHLVGEPTAQLLLHENATVTLCHSHTENLADIVRSADIVVFAAGKPNLVRPEDLKEGAVVVDVAMNRVNNMLVGDIYCPENLSILEQRLSAITPVPGGVGPMTIAMLMKNVVDLQNRDRTD